MTSTALIDYDAEFAKIAGELQTSLASVGGSYIGTKGKCFTFPSGHVEPTLNCIVLDFIPLNQLMTPYNPNVRGITRCWAIGRDASNLVPSNDSPQRQADSCATCTSNQYGSATNGGRGKACANTYRLAITPADATESSDIWLLKVSPTGQRQWNDYKKLMDAKYGPGGFCRGVTKISFDPNREYPSLMFADAGEVTNKAVIFPLRQRAIDVILTPPPGE